MSASDRRYWDEAWETTPWDELSPEIDRRLRAQLAWVAERSPLYRRTFAEAGVDPLGVGLADLHELPFMSKSDVQRSQAAAPPLGEHACVDWDEISRIHASSGTTGQPTLIGLTERDREMWDDLIARCMWAMGARPGSRAWVQSSLGWWISGLTFVDALQRLGAAVLPGGSQETARSFAVVQRTGADFVISTPSFVKYLAQFAREKLDLDVATLGIRHMGVGGEPGAGLPHVRRQLEETWGCKVYDTMGTADFSTLVWSECEHQDGMHFQAQGYVVPEIVDADGTPLPPETGAVGELVCTAIWRECTPLIRYRTGDMVEVVSSERCGCGRTGFRIRCGARTDDMLIAKGVNVFPSAVADVVASLRPRTTGQMQILAPASGTAIEPPVPVVVETAGAADDADQLKRELEDRIRRQLIFRADVRLVPEGSLAPQAGMKSPLVKRLTDDEETR